jgi:hypothetical protein
MRKEFRISIPALLPAANVRLIFLLALLCGAFAVVVVVAFFEPKPRQGKLLLAHEWAVA